MKKSEIVIAASGRTSDFGNLYIVPPSKATAAMGAKFGAWGMRRANTASATRPIGKMNGESFLSIGLMIMVRLRFWKGNGRRNPPSPSFE